MHFYLPSIHHYRTTDVGTADGNTTYSGRPGIWHSQNVLDADDSSVIRACEGRKESLLTGQVSIIPLLLKAAFLKAKGICKQSLLKVSLPFFDSPPPQNQHWVHLTHLHSLQLHTYLVLAMGTAMSLLDVYHQSASHPLPAAFTIKPLRRLCGWETAQLSAPIHVCGVPLYMHGHQEKETHCNYRAA